MIDFNLDNYKNHKESFIRIQKKSLELDFLLNEVDIEYANKITGELGNEITNQFLKAISYRMESIIFHYNLLYNINPKDQKSSFQEIEISIRQNSLFDSIIFHTASFFDYFSCFTWYVIGDKAIKKKLWTSLAKSARSNDKLNKSKIGILIGSVDSDWVCKLFDYRADLIHYKDDWANEIYKIEDKEMIIQSPENILKFFKIHKKIDILNTIITIEQISLWVIESSIDICTELANNLKPFIDNNRKRETDVIQIRDINDPEVMKEIIGKMKNNT